MSCRHHLLPVRHGRSSVLWGCQGPHRPLREWTEDEIEDVLVGMEETCVLDVAGRGRITLERIASLLGGLSRERVRQIEAKALRRCRGLCGGYVPGDWIDRNWDDLHGG